MTEARQQVPEEALGGCRVSPLLKQDVDDLTVLVDGAPQIPLPTLDPDEDLVDEEGVAAAAVPAAQPVRVMGSELVAPEADRLVADEDPRRASRSSTSRWLRLKR
jgi:hypothetical protein